jgi:DNA-binding LacI/PurR family transcriptional regulator
MTESQRKKLMIGNWTRERGYFMFKELISSEQFPLAVLCSNDHMAIGVLQACMENGWEKEYSG